MRIKAVMAVVALSAAASLVYGTSAQAARVPEECMPGIGKDVPILMIHGLNDSREIWEQGNALAPKVDQLKGFQSRRFDYNPHAAKWVDHSEIGPKLAQRIACIAESSRKGGGAGKVVTIGHSMGGLAVRYAADQTVNGHKVADDLGLMVDIGTPHRGSMWGDFFREVLGAVCTLGNPLDLDAMIRCYNQRSAVDGLALMAAGERLDKLPLPPSNVPLLNIAGDVQIGLEYAEIFRMQWGRLDSDVVVEVSSALAFSNEVKGMGGNVVVSCDLGQIKFPNDDSCAHNGLPRNPIVHEKVVEALLKYAASLRPKAQACSVNRPELQERLNYWFEDEFARQGLRSFTITGTACEGKWMVVGLRKKYRDREEEAGVPFEQMPEGGWMPHENESACPQLPQKLKPLARCK